MAQQDLDTADPIVLARTPSFRLAGAEIRPATRQIVRDGRSETLEPRVMQLLIALAEAGGEIVTRDELVMRCWEGRIVGENAIHRAVSRLRDTALGIGAGAFRVETIPRVGYRIVTGSEEPASSAHAATPPAGAGDTAAPPSRRGVVLGGGAAALAAAGVGAWLFARQSGRRPHPEALELYRRGQIAQRQGQAEQVRQAVAFFQQATELDPLYADAWGALALSYRHILEGYAQGDVESLPDLIRSAARRALGLDPGNQIGRASCRGRVLIFEFADSLKNNNHRYYPVP